MKRDYLETGLTIVTTLLAFVIMVFIIFSVGEMLTELFE